jgi:hypothetical protein
MPAEIGQQSAHRGSRLTAALHQDRRYAEPLQQQNRFAVLLGVDQRPDVAGMGAQRVLQGLR